MDLSSFLPFPARPSRSLSPHTLTKCRSPPARTASSACWRPRRRRRRSWRRRGKVKRMMEFFFDALACFRFSLPRAGVSPGTRGCSWATVHISDLRLGWEARGFYSLTLAERAKSIHFPPRGALNLPLPSPSPITSQPRPTASRRPAPRPTARSRPSKRRGRRRTSGRWRR